MFPSKLKSIVEFAIKTTPPHQNSDVQPIIDAINKFSERIRGEHSSATYKLLNELTVVVEKKCDSSLQNQFGAFSTFRQNYEKFIKGARSIKKVAKPKKDEFVFVPSTWKFQPDRLTEHQKEKLKEKRDDIPALYNDLSRSQDSQSISLKPWTPTKQRQSNGEPLNQAKSSDEINDDGVNDLQPSQVQNASSTPLQSNTDTISVPSPDQKEEIDAERKRKRVQNELNKLSLSLKNAEQYSQVIGRTRRMTINIVVPETRLRKRSNTVTIQKPPHQAKRPRKSLTQTTETNENEPSEVIEASQLIPVPPTTRRTRQTKHSSIKMNGRTVEDTAPEKVGEENRSADEKTIQANTTEQTTIANLNSTSAIKKKECAILQTNIVDQSEGVNGEIPVDINEKQIFPIIVAVASHAEISTAKPEQTVIPQISNDPTPIRDARSVVTSNSSDEVSPVVENSDGSQISSGIITSPSSSKNRSKTTELLNSTVNISPIPHAKTATKDQTSELGKNQQTNTKSIEYCDENIDADRIRRTDLDNLIKSPMDSPLLQTQTTMCSTPQSRRNTKRKVPVQGRGAQLLEMMNIRKAEDIPLANAKTPKIVSVTSIASTETDMPTSNNIPTYESIVASSKRLFRFSKVLPSPSASPTSSIIKRNEMAEVDDTESSNQKRKRVSFHDPPVSATKEFIRFTEEINPSRTRTPPPNARNVLPRNSRFDSFNDIRRELEDTPETSDPSETSMQSLNWNSNDDHNDNVSTTPITFSNKDEVLVYVLNEFSTDHILGVHRGMIGTTEDLSSSFQAASDHLQLLLTNHLHVLTSVADDFLKKFPKLFLNTSFQENFTSRVMEALPSNNLLNCIKERSQTDGALKKQLMEMFNPLTTTTKMKEEKFRKVLELVSEGMNEPQVYQMLAALFGNKPNSNCS